MRRTWTAALLVVALAGVAAGCGGSSDDETTADPTAAWASGFCSAVTTWTDDLQSITQQFTDTSNLSQDGLASAADDARTSTQELVDSLKALGAPETDSRRFRLRYSAHSSASVKPVSSPFSTWPSRRQRTRPSPSFSS